METLRRTSVYTLSTDDEPDLLSRLIRECPVQVSEALVSSGKAKLRFRTPGGDKRAREIAKGLVGTRSHHLSTGVGIHHRCIY